MKVALRIDTKAALLAGSKATGTKVVTVDPADLTPAERTWLAAYTSAADASTGADLKLFDYIATTTGTHHFNFPVATPEALKAEAAAGVARWAAEDEAFAAADAASLLKNCGYGYKSDLPAQLAHPDRYPRLAARRAELEAAAAAERAAYDRAEAEKKAANEAERRDREAADAREKADREAKLTLLAEWARSHGSDTCKLRLEEGFASWASLALEEWTEARHADLGTDDPVPDGFEFATAEERLSPTAKEVLALRRVKGLLADGESARLVVIRYVPGEDEDNDYDDEPADPVVRTEIEVTVNPFGLGTRDVFVAVG
jgi:hypothetical protein